MTFENRPINELTPRMQQLFERARASFQGARYAYAIELLRTILMQEPGCAEVRRVLHAVYRELHARDGALRRWRNALGVSWALRTKVPRLFRRKEYPVLLSTLEELIERAPGSEGALVSLARVAVECGAIDTATVALESLVTAAPRNPKAWRRYVDHCRRHDLHKRALQGLLRLAKLRPNDLEIQTQLREVTAADTVAGAHWDEAGTYRDILRDEEEAVRLEEERRPQAMTSEESLQTQLAAAKADVKRLPSIDNRRRYGELLRRYGDLDGALHQFEEAGNATNHLDPAIEDAIVACLHERADGDIERWQRYARENPERAELAAERIRELESTRDEGLLARYEFRVKRFPLEARYQAELADAYLEFGRFDEALRAYQAARRNPSFNLRAGIGAARSMAGKGLADLAEREFLACLGLVSGRNDPARLEILYDLYRLYAGQERQEDSVRQLKEIYALNASYRDVSARLDEYVRQRDTVGPANPGNSGEKTT